MDLQTIAFIITGVLGIVASFFGLRYNKVKLAFKETKEALVTVVDAIEDNTVTDTELQAITKEAKEAASAWVDVFKK
jgi:hypothetical protein